LGLRYPPGIGFDRLLDPGGWKETGPPLVLQPVRFPSEVNDRAVMEEAIEDRRGDLLWLYFDRVRRRWFLQGWVE
jgi:hypothetical protein